jgi:hypothetical protein
VKLNGVAATGVVSGFDADGFAALLVNLSRNQPGPLIAGPLAVQVIRTRDGRDDRPPVAESQIVHTTVTLP